MKRLTVGILAHVDSGKTTLSEALLFKSGAIRTLGRVDHRNTLLDSFELERKRGITIFSKIASFRTHEFDVTLIDTPGHIDFSGEAERTLSILDAAILVISGQSGVQSHTITLWHLLRKHSIPTIIFVNKMDIQNADKVTLTSGIHKKLSSSAIDIEKFDSGEDVAMCSDDLMEKYLSGEHIEASEISNAFMNCSLFPVIFGSALKLDGIEELTSTIDSLCCENEYQSDFGARVYKINVTDSDGRLTFLKVTGGSISVKDTISYTDKSGTEFSEKVTGIRLYQGDKFSAVQTAESGTVCAVMGLSSLLPGDTLGFEENNSTPSLIPVLSYKITYPGQYDSHTIMSKLRILEAEDPNLHVSYNEANSEITMLLMGEVQLEAIKYDFSSRFGIDIDFSEGGIVYRETIENEVEGIGHYEPLRHYSEVHLLLTPLERGAGLVFDTECDTDLLEKNWQRLVLTHLEEKIHIGVLTGSPITDMKITLVAGKAHKKHTEGGDFRQATYRAVRQGLMKTKSILLEPWYSFEITVPTENIGRVMTDMQNMSASFSSPDSDGEFSTLTGSAPAVEVRSYATVLRSLSHGKGTISLSLCGYDICHNQTEVVASSCYFPEADIDNSPDSIFCSGGTGFLVPWNEVEGYMHLESYFAKSKEEIEQARELKRRAQSYVSAVATDKELMEIFERTYGKIKPRSVQKAKIIGTRKEVKAPKQKPSHAPKGPEYLLIDGYNIIFAWDEMKRLAISKLEDARLSLIDRICNYQGFYGGEIILVFDAYRVHKSPGSIEDFRNIKVVYTKEAETADTYIEKTAHKLSKEHIVRVATSDGPEQMIILGSGALRVPAKNFIKEITDAEKAIRYLIE